MEEDVERLQEKVHDLRERVNYLERELEMSVDEQRFERQVKRVVPTGNDYEIGRDGMGYYNASINIHPADLPHAVSTIDKIDDIGWQVKDTDDESITLSVKQGLVN